MEKGEDALCGTHVARESHYTRMTRLARVADKDRSTLQNFVILHPDNQNFASVEGAVRFLTWVNKKLTASLEWNVGAEKSDMLAELQSFHPDLVAACRWVSFYESFLNSVPKAGNVR